MKIKKIIAMETALMLIGMTTGCGESDERSSSGRAKRHSSHSSSISKSETAEFDVSELTPDKWEDCLKYEIVYGSEAEITDCSGSAVYVVIPDMIDGYPVTSIAKSAFSDCKKLKAVEIGKNVKYIGVDAFKHSGLEYVSIPDSVTEIASGAFEYTPLYKKYEEGIIYIDGWAVGCASEESELKFKKGTRGISFMAFANSDYIKTVDIPSSAIIESSAFMNCKNLTSVTFGDDVRIIGSQAFDGCYSINNIEFGNGITEIRDSAFRGCHEVSAITLPESLIEIHGDVFYSSAITSITIPEKVEIVGMDAFNGCDQLESITFESKNCQISGSSQIGDTIPYGTLVRGYWGSTAEKFAEEWYHDFEGLDDGNRYNSGAAEDAYTITDISSSNGCTAAITEDGSLYMWGVNYLFQEDMKIPCKIMDNVKKAFTGAGSTAAITKDGVLYVWGFNDNNQLGVSNGKRSDVILYPHELMENVKDVAIGSTYGAAVTEDGSVYTWGRKKTQQDPVTGMGKIKSISAGDDHFAALAEDGSLYMWGVNYEGQLGIGEYNDRNSFNPNTVKVMDNVVSVSCGNNFTAAVTENGALYTWGANGFGQLGNGNTTSSNVPIQIMDDVKSVSAKGYNLMALKNTGEVYVFEHDQTVSGNSNVVSVDIHGSSPVKIMDDAVSISCGGGHYSAVDTNGDIYTWGSNSHGELGDGTKEDSEKPVKVYITGDNPMYITE